MVCQISQIMQTLRGICSAVELRSQGDTHILVYKDRVLLETNDRRLIRLYQKHLNEVDQEDSDICYYLARIIIHRDERGEGAYMDHILHYIQDQLQ